MRLHFALAALLLLACRAPEERDTASSAEVEASASASVTPAPKRPRAASSSPASPSSLPPKGLTRSGSVSSVSTPPSTAPSAPEPIRQRSARSSGVTDAGAEPRSLLRYSFKKGDVSRLSLKTEMTLSLGNEGAKFQAQPPIAIHVLDRVMVTALLPNGARREHHFDEFRVVPPPETPKAVRAQLDQQVAQLTNVFVLEEVSERGESLEFSLENVPQNGGEQLIDPLRNMIEQMMVPLPETKVGKGARWETLRTLETMGTVIEQRTEYTLVGLEGTTLDVELSQRQKGRPGPVNPPGLPTGTTATLVSLTSDMTGQQSVDLKTFSLSFSFSQTQNNETLVDSGGKAMRMRTRVVAKSTATPKL